MFAEAVSSLFTSGVRSRVNASLENPAFSLNDPTAYEALNGGSRSASGVVVTHENSLMIAAVYQAVSLISGDVSKLPLYPFKRLPEDDREIASKHPAYFATAIRANPWKSAKRFWRDLMVHSLIYTNGYGYISAGAMGLELYNLLPDRTAPEWVAGANGTAKLIYVTEVAGKLRPIDPSQIIHVRGISLDGIQGADLTKYARDAWGLALAAQNFESKFFKNGARMGGTLELPIGMSKPAKDNVEEGFRKSYEEGDNPFKTVILREGAKFHAGQVTPQEGQVAELRDDQKREVASFFNLPPSKLGIRDSVSYNSFEQESLAYKEGCLSHWTGDIADECDMKLLSEKELRDDTHYFEHNYSRFGQADTKTLNESLEIMRRNEVINADEWRRKLNMNKRPDGKGGEYINPNTRSADSQPAPDPQPTKKSSNVHQNLIADTINRMARRVAHDARNASKSPAKFLAWLDGDAADHRAIFDEAASPVAAVVAVAMNGCEQEIAAAMHAGFFDILKAVLSPLVEAGNAAADLQTNVDRELSNFERTAGERIAAKILDPENV
jgi:HK97 family phage portal protein